MSRRTAPRPLAGALERWVAGAAPEGLLPQLQARWEELAGAAVAAEAQPHSERSGTVTIRCHSAVWAHELELLAPDLKRRLNEAFGTPAQAEPVSGLRFVVAKP